MLLERRFFKESIAASAHREFIYGGEYLLLRDTVHSYQTYNFFSFQLQLAESFQWHIKFFILNLRGSYSKF